MHANVLQPLAVVAEIMKIQGTSSICNNILKFEYEKYLYLVFKIKN